MPEPDVPLIVFHGTHPKHRQTIQAGGLTPQPVPQDGQAGVWDAVVFLTPDPEEAAAYGADIWQVDLTGIEHDIVGGPDGAHIITPHQISFSRLTLHPCAPTEMELDGT